VASSKLSLVEDFEINPKFSDSLLIKKLNYALFSLGGSLFERVPVSELELEGVNNIFFLLNLLNAVAKDLCQTKK